VEQPPEKALRRVPTQKRSRVRLEAILDAGAELFADAGFEATTMEAVAARAETSIGSVYQFFPNKLALFRAIADLSFEHCRELFGRIIPTTSLSPEDWIDVLDAAIDGFASLQESDASVRMMWKNWNMYAEIADKDAALHREFMDSTRALVGFVASDIPDARRDLLATMIVEVISAMLFLTQRHPDRRKAMLEETKRMVRRYLEPELRGPSCG